MKTFQQFCEDAYQLSEENLLDRTRQFAGRQLTNIKRDPVGTIWRGVAKPFVKSVALDMTGIPDEIKRRTGNNPAINTAIDYGGNALSYVPWRKTLTNLPRVVPRVAQQALQTGTRLAQGGLELAGTLAAINRAGGEF